MTSRAEEHAQFRPLSPGKERDAETNNDYFGARYYNSDTGRFLSPDWSAKFEPVPYAKMDDPQTLNLYGYVRNNPLSTTDPDGHAYIDVEAVIRDLKQAASDPYVQGGAKVLVGGGLVLTAAFGDVPGGAVGALLVANAALGGTATAVNGTAQIIGTATHADTSEAREVVGSTSTLPGLATAATGHMKAAATVSTVTNAATLAAAPKEALKNPATAADAVSTVKETGSLVKDTVSYIKSVISGAMAAPPPPPSPPKPPSTPDCASFNFNGGCH